MTRLQVARLQEAVARAYARVPFYRKKFDGAGVRPEQIRSLDDLRRLPFTIKDDLRDNYPYGLFAVPLRTRGGADPFLLRNDGIPTVVGYTRRDLQTWANLVVRFRCRCHQ
ncbi:MAG: phenylacetate--CoA ligase [Firmicutes bacterium]|nr:phenylacetate--CoA ligase [Bacillota bacterium]